MSTKNDASTRCRPQAQRRHKRRKRRGQPPTARKYGPQRPHPLAPRFFNPNGEHIQAFEEEMLPRLPDNLDTLARQTGALTRRRGFTSASQLLHSVLVWATLGISIRACAATLAAVYTPMEEGSYRNRFKKMAPFLASLIQRLLQIPEMQSRQGPALRLMDSSCLQRPRSKGTDWRLHVTFDLNTGRMSHFELTDAHGAEFSSRSPAAPHDVLMGDINYGTARNFHDLQDRGVYALLRVHAQRIRLIDPNTSRPFALESALTYAERHGPCEFAVEVPFEKRKHNARLAILPLSEEQAKKARESLRKRRKGDVLKELTVRLAGFVFLLTSLPKSIGPEMLGNLYRLRWQIEVFFKLCKSLLNFDDLPKCTDALCEVRILAQMLKLLILQQGLDAEKAAEAAAQADEASGADSRKDHTRWRQMQLLNLAWSLILIPSSLRSALDGIGQTALNLLKEGRRKRQQAVNSASQALEALQRACIPDGYS